MDPIAVIGSTLALIISASIGVYLMRAQKRVADAGSENTIADTVIKLGQRVGTLESEQAKLRAGNRKCQQENHQLQQWGAVLIEQLVKAEVVPMTFEEFKNRNGY